MTATEIVEVIVEAMEDQAPENEVETMERARFIRPSSERTADADSRNRANIYPIG
jgi:hypothetical protein